MLIYNTLTRQKEEFVAIEKNKVRMYVCGPTVYDFFHIGNARPYVVFDTVRRYFEYKGFEVNYIQNYTDVDDKIINKAKDENVDFRVISERFIKEALRDADGLNVKRAIFNPKVSEEMDEIIKMISDLIKKDYAYEVKNTVYFRTDAAKSYGKLSNKKIDDLEAGARVALDERKENPMDFVLWKPAKEGEPSWDSPFGAGRPGWHIECSAMAKKYLGDTIDIHAGGEDLIFPHHENEIAQSEAANGEEFAKYWMHNGYINIDNKKMSKSLGNFFTVRDISKKYSYDVIRFFILSVHYRSPMNFSEELLLSSKAALDRIKTAIKNIEFLLENNKEEGTLSENIQENINKYKNNFIKHMDDDFNTADAISSMFEIVKFSNSTFNENSNKADLKYTLDTILELSDILALLYLDEKDSIDSKKIESLIEEREEARKNKDWALADKIRDDLTNEGIILEDTPSGVKWSIKS